MIATNADQLGTPRLKVIAGAAPEAYANLPRPHAVFIGGGANQAGLETVWALIPDGTRLVANAVTIETESLFADWQARKGGELMRVEIAVAAPLGRMRGWAMTRPVLQWSVVK